MSEQIKAAGSRPGKGPSNPIDANIDLKWSIWSADPSIWEERAPKTLALLREGIDEGMIEETGDAVEIWTHPSKPFRWGWLLVESNDKGDGVKARVIFRTGWDEPHYLMDTLGYSQDEIDDPKTYDAFVEVAPWTGGGDTGIEVDRTVTATSAKELLRKVEEVESDLLKEDEKAWSAFKKEHGRSGVVPNEQQSEEG